MNSRLQQFVQRAQSAQAEVDAILVEANAVGYESDATTIRRSIVEYNQDPQRGYLFKRTLGPGVPHRVRDLYLFPMTYGNLRIALSPAGDTVSISEAYCYHDRPQAWFVALHWDGMGEPSGWIRHPASGRRRQYDADGQLLRSWVRP